MLEVRHLTHAVMLAEHRSFAKAARSLSLSQPALSRSIQALEGQLGLKLFDRSRKGVDPTEGGLLLLKRAKDLIAQFEDLEKETGAVSRGHIGELKIAVGPYPAKMIAGPAVGALLSQWLDLRFRIEIDNWSEATRMVRERDVELAICDVSETDQSVFDVVPLAVHQAYCLVRPEHPLAKKSGSKFSEVRRWPHVVSAALPPRVLSQLGTGGRLNSSPSAVHCEDLEVLKEVVLRSDTVMFSPLCLMEKELNDGSLVALPCEEAWLKTNYGIVRLRGRNLPPVAEHFIERAKEVDQQCLRQGAKLRAGFISQSSRRKNRHTKSIKGTSVRK